MSATSHVVRIAIFGPESTGKTTLAQELAKHFGEPWVPEYVRHFWDEHAGQVSADDLDEIARGQIDGEEAAAARARKVLFCDTELLTNVLWADLLFPGKCPEWVRVAADKCAKHYALYLLCETDVPFMDDEQRCFPDEEGRRMCMHLWTQTLEKRGLPYIKISGSWDERRERATQAVQDVLDRA